MNFDYSAAPTELVERLESFMDEHIYPNEARYFRESMELGPWAVWPVVEELKPLAREAGLWNLFLPDERARRRPQQPRVRAALRGDGPIAPRAGGVQLLGARHRQHGGARPLRHGRAAGTVAAAAARRRDPLGLRDDRAGRRLQRRHQHRELDRARRRRLRHQRPQVVHDQRHRPAVQDHHLHGQVRSGQPGPAPAAVDDPRADGHAGCHGGPAAAGVQLLRHARPRRRGRVRRRACPGVQHAARRRARLRDRPGPPRAGPHPSLHAPDRARRTGAGDDVPADPAPRRPSAGRSPSRP